MARCRHMACVMLATPRKRHLARDSSPGTSLTAIFARDLPLYYSYRRFYVPLAQKLFWYSSCDHGVEPRRSISWAVVYGRPNRAHRREPNTKG